MHGVEGEEKEEDESGEAQIRVDENYLDRDVIGPTNIGLRYLNLNGRLMALVLTEHHEVWLKLMISYQDHGIIPRIAMVLKTLISNYGIV